MATMKAMVLREHGGPEVLKAEEVALPEPGPGEVRVKVAAVALNHLDIWVRRGGPAFKLEYPHRLGSDIAGTIDAFGPGADTGQVAIGDRVVLNPGVSCGHCQACLSGNDNLCRHYRILGESTQGGYGEYLVVPRANLAPFPKHCSFEEAAAVLLPFLTAWQMLVRKARVCAGETVLIHGAGSGVGVAATQICKLLGARIIATAGSDEKLAKARELGADEAINYQTEDFVAITRKLTGKRGVDVVFEHVGGETFARSIKAACNGGRIVTCGATSGHAATVDLRHIFFRQIQILGSTMGSKGDLFDVLAQVEAKTLRPVIDRVMPLEQAATAHQLLEDRQAFGKIVLTT